MSIDEILIKHFGWTEQEVLDKQDILKFVHINSEELALQKAQFYQEEFNLSKEEFIKMVKVLSSLLMYTEENVRKKSEFYQREFKLSKEEFVKMLKVLPSLLALSEESIKEKVAFYQEEFHLNKEEFIKMLKLMPSLLAYSEESVRSKSEFFRSEFNISKEKFVNMIVHWPSLLGYLEDMIREKIIFYQKLLSIDKKECDDMLKRMPVLIGLSEESIKEKYRQISDLNISSDVIVSDPSILTAPKNTLKLRYIILRQIASREEILSRPKWFMTNQNKTFARIAFLKSQGYQQIKLSAALANEREFQKKNKHSENFMEKYKLTTADVALLESMLKSGEMEEFKAEEKKYIEDEYGAYHG